MASSYMYDDWDRAEVLPFVPEANRILEVGCSYGGFGQLLKGRSNSPEVWGIEPEPKAAEVAASRLDRVIVGDFPALAPVGERFDCVVFNDVLEHLVDPWGALRCALGLLRPNGCVVASIPNVRFGPVVSALLLRGRWNYTDVGVLDRTHLRFFTRSSMIEMFKECGYDVSSVNAIRQIRRGRIARTAKLFGSHATEFTAPQFVIVATTSEPRA